MTSYGSSSAEEVFAVLFSAMGVGAFFLMLLLFFVLIIAMMIAVCFPYYRMAKRAGMPNAWLAFVPVANLYITLNLSRREFNIFNWIVCKDRTKVFWYALAGYGIFFGLILLLAILSAIPFLGIIFAILYYIIMTVFYIPIYIFTWRMNYDLLMTYGMEEHAMWASIVNCFFPILMIVFSYIIMNKEPNYDI